MSMRVIAVSQSVPQWLDINGMRVSTSIIHSPLTSPSESITLEGTLGIHGNEPAAHDGEVYGFFAHHYDYWTQRLGVARDAWDWCHWGENITFQCDDAAVSESDFHIGDIWQIGPDVLLQVCGSRVPCFKLAWRCGQSDKWLQALAATGKCGVYLKILHGGRIHPGHIAVLKSRRTGVAPVDCATVTRLAYDASLSTRDTFNLLAEDPDLLNMNRLIFRRKLSVLRDRSLQKMNSWKGWRSVRVTRVQAETPNVKSFYLVPDGEDGRPLAAYLPGQFLTVRLPNGLLRSWSISSYTSDEHRAAPPQYRISIKMAGAASTWMHNNCEMGTVLHIRSPSGSFCLDWSPAIPGRQVYISAGIGITPMLSMLQAHLEHQVMQRAPAVWIHVSPSVDDIPFVKELHNLLSTPNARELGLQAVLFLTRADDRAERGPGRMLHSEHMTIYNGRPTLETLKDLLGAPYYMDPLQIKPIEVEGRFSTVYLCGPVAFEHTMRQFLSAIGIQKSMIFSENFGSQQEKPPLDTAEVRLLRSKRKLVWQRRKPLLQHLHSDSPIPNGEALKLGREDGIADSTELDEMGPSILELAEQAGLTPDYGCRVGSCGSCEAALKCGKVAGGMQIGGTVRVCVARPASEVLEFDL